MDLERQDRPDERRKRKYGLGFGSKGQATGECDVLILDEILGRVEYGIWSSDDIRALLGETSEGTEIIFTGQNLCREIMDLADFVYQITTLKEQGCCAKEDAKEEGYGNI